MLLRAGEHQAVIAELYGEGKPTVPALLVGDEPVKGSRAILERLEQLAPEPPLYPEPGADEIRAAERWGDEEFQHDGRVLAWGCFHFRPERALTFAGLPVADPAMTDFSIRFVEATWRYQGINAAGIASVLETLPAKLDHIDGLIAAGVIGGQAPNAADLQIGATVRMLLNLGDLAPLIEARPATAMARRWFPEWDGWVPAGAFPAGWVPSP